MSKHTLQTVFDTTPPTDNFWDGAYKIPWNDPKFSARMLEIHLSQDTDLASRNQKTISEQADWIMDNLLRLETSHILDLGCGPGLYADCFADRKHLYRGIDFSPASIRYAKENTRHPGLCEFTEGDVCTTDFGANNDLIMMLYGELDVFSPAQCESILKRAHAALAGGGALALEVHTEEAVRLAGEQPASWHRAESGLFSDRPHIWLQENHWSEEHGVATQYFHVLEVNGGGVSTMRSTTKAWTDQKRRAMLAEAGFRDIIEHADWPRTNEHFKLITARKA